MFKLDDQRASSLMDLSSEKVQFFLPLFKAGIVIISVKLGNNYHSAHLLPGIAVYGTWRTANGVTAFVD